MSLEEAQVELKERWGHDEFREAQAQVLEYVFAGRDVLAILPTGYGKSVTFQVPALLAEGTALVISPLIALMKDQVDDCLDRGISATYINSHVDEGRARDRLDGFVHGDYKLLYIAPERMRNRSFMGALSRADVSYLVVDEAHCASRWGHDFRPMYSRIRDLLSPLAARGKRPPIIAVTATATGDIEEDIAESLGMHEDYARVIGDPVRPNISYEIFHAPPGNYGEWRALDMAIPAVREPGRHIIYTGTRKSADMLAEKVRDQFRVETVGVYHGGMPQKDRERMQDGFKSGKLTVVCATCAFGMGIDVPDIRTVIHFGIPGSLEDYVQETGRAGRDGKDSRAILVESSFAEQLQYMFLDTANPKWSVYEAVWKYLHEASDGPGDVLYESASDMAGEIKRSQCLELYAGVVSTVLNTMESFGVINRSYSGAGNRVTVKFDVIDDAIKNPGKYELNENQQRVVEWVMETIVDGEEPGVTYEGFIDRMEATRALGLSPATVMKHLRTLSDLDILDLEAAYTGKATQIKKRNFGLKIEDLLDRRGLEEKRAREEARLVRMIGYQSTKNREDYIREYFMDGPA